MPGISFLPSGPDPGFEAIQAGNQTGSTIANILLGFQNAKREDQLAQARIAQEQALTQATGISNQFNQFQLEQAKTLAPTQQALLETSLAVKKLDYSQQLAGTDLQSAQEAQLRARTATEYALQPGLVAQQQAQAGLTGSEARLRALQADKEAQDVADEKAAKLELDAAMNIPAIQQQYGYRKEMAQFARPGLMVKALDQLQQTKNATDQIRIQAQYHQTIADAQAGYRKAQAEQDYTKTL